MILLASRPRRNKAFLFEFAAVILMTASTAVSRFIVSARLNEIRVQLGENLARLPVTDPTRTTFDLLHQVSVGLISFNLLAAVALIILLLWQGRQAR